MDEGERRIEGKRRSYRDPWRWTLGLFYIVAVAGIWIAASYIVQSVVDAGVSPFLITYICNSLFVIYIPLVEVARYVEDSFPAALFWRGSGPSGRDVGEEQSTESEDTNLLNTVAVSSGHGEDGQPLDIGVESLLPVENENLGVRVLSDQVDEKGRWTRRRVAKVSLLVCPFWFMAQLTFNLSLKYTTVTSNTILSSASSLFTFLVSLVFLDERFTWLKFISVLLCMAGTVIVSLGDSATGGTLAINALLGDVLALGSSCLYAVYITLIRVKLPDENKGEGQASMAQFLGFLGLFNLIIFLPVALVLNFTGIEPFHMLNMKQFGLVVGKGLLDNVLSDYLWAKAILLTTTTVATAGLTIQVPIAAVVDSLTGNAPHLLDYLGALAVMIGFAGININSDDSSTTQEVEHVPHANQVSTDHEKPDNRR